MNNIELLLNELKEYKKMNLKDEVKYRLNDYSESLMNALSEENRKLIFKQFGGGSK